MVKRKQKKRDLRELKWHICTEGISEELYLKAYCKALGIAHLIDFNCGAHSSQGCGKQHLSLLEKIQKCNRNLNYAKTFAVHDFDADGIEKKIQSFDEAYRNKSEYGVDEVYYSIPSFEYWLLLHISHLDTDLDGRTCANKAREHVNAQLKAKGKSPLTAEDFKTFPDLFLYFGGLEGAAKAIVHAHKFLGGCSPAKKPSTRRPSTNIHLLLELLDDRVKE